MSLTAVQQALEHIPLPYLCTDASFRITWRNKYIQEKLPYLNPLHTVGPLLLGHDGNELLQLLSTTRESVTILCRLPLVRLTLSFSPLSFDESGAVQEILVAFTQPHADTIGNDALAYINESLCRPMDGLFSTIDYLRRQLRYDYSSELSAMIQSCYQMLRNCFYIAEYSDLVSNFKPLDVRYYNIREYLQRTLDPIIEPLQRRNIKLTVETPDSLTLVPFDEKKMNIILFSLICNSCTFCNTDNEISITVSVTESKCHITVADKGFGIPVDVMPLAMDAYFSKGGENEARPGLGLGLTLCKTIIERHNGSIELDSVLDHGLIVKMTLPLHVEISSGNKGRLHSSKSNYVSERYPLHAILLSPILPMEELL